MEVAIDTDTTGGTRLEEVRVAVGGGLGHAWRVTGCVSWRPMTLEPGLTAKVRDIVDDTDTALALGSGDVPVLGTPRVLALVEQATVKAVAGHLDEGETTVGAGVQLDHMAPTPVGMTVEAEATLAKVEGRRLVFVVRVTDDRGLVAAGKITRAMVDRERFVENAGAAADGGS